MDRILAALFILLNQQLVVASTHLLESGAQLKHYSIHFFLLIVIIIPLG